MSPRSILGLLTVAVLLGACASRAPAPLIERTPALLERGPAGEGYRPGYYTVKKGDTLYSIALEHGQDYKDVAAWNNLDNPNLINVGQQLRVESPAGAPQVAETRPVAAPPAVQARPLSPGANTETYKREPKVGTQPYSDQAWAKIQQPQAPPSSAKAEEPPPPEKPAPPAAAVTTSGDEAIDWAWPTSGKLIAPYAEGSNKGIDISGRIGQPILAAASGKVTLVSNALRGYGNLVVVKHNATYLSVYAHTSKILVKEGDSVSRGQHIADLGNSDTDQPKLHFEIRRRGKPVDPAQFLPAR